MGAPTPHAQRSRGDAMRAERRFTGAALALGDDVNTDELHPSRFFSLDDTKVASGFLQALPDRRGTDVEAGRIVVGGANFGVGSSRETGARVFLLHGVRAVVAESFARIYFRNVVNLGLPALVCRGLRQHVREGDALTVDLDASTVTLPDGRVFQCDRYDPLQDAIVRAGGLVAYLGLDPAAAGPR